jgi:ribosomal-protein-alanine N-acetyltransferase
MMSAMKQLSMNDPVLHLHRIDPQPSPVVRDACAEHELVAQTIQATLDLYMRKGFFPPWTGYLAKKDARVVGCCGFASPPVNGEAEIAYITVPGNEGQGIARQMATALMHEARRTAKSEVFIAHTLPQEEPSTSILKRLGFEFAAAVEHPEDGLIWKWRKN